MAALERNDSSSSTDSEESVVNDPVWVVTNAGASISVPKKRLNFSEAEIHVNQGCK